jgi:hypothetical protein
MNAATMNNLSREAEEADVAKSLVLDQLMELRVIVERLAIAVEGLQGAASLNALTEARNERMSGQTPIPRTPPHSGKSNSVWPTKTSRIGRRTARPLSIAIAPRRRKLAPSPSISTSYSRIPRR